jgi:putative nucleotidyltransferase with HDIG domain
MFASQLTPAGRIYLRTVSILGASVVLESLFRLLQSPLQPQWFLLALLTLISGSASVKLPWAQVSISISEAFVFTAVLLYGPAAGTLTVVLDCLVISFWISKRHPNMERAIFNIAAPALSLWCSAHLFFYTAGIRPLVEQPVSFDPTATLSVILPSLILFAIAYFGLNSWLITFVIAIEKHENPWRIWRTGFIWLSLNYFCGASVAVLLVGYNRTIDLRFVAVVVPLLLVLYFTFKTSMERVEDANKHVEQLNSLYLSTIETLAMAIDAKDQVTHGHIRRVQIQATGLAKQVGVRDEKLIKAIEAAALLHDMGKLAVPEYILNKPGKLTEAEFSKMKLHASVGADILSAIEFPYPVVPIVRYHHENWDGTGYPEGLRGTEIPIGARILSVVDCFDALTSDRPYRPKLSDDDAIQILIERRGTMYDPLIVDTFIKGHSSTSSEANRKLLTNDVLRTIASSQSAAPQIESPTLDQITASADEMPTLYELARALASQTHVEGVAETTVNHIRRLIPFSLCVFYEYDAIRDELEASHTIGDSRSSVHGLRIPIGQRLSGWVAANRRTICNSDPRLDFGDTARSQTVRLRSCIGTPLLAGEQLTGVMTLYATEMNAFTDDHRRVIELIAKQIAPWFRRHGERESAVRQDSFIGPSSPNSRTAH